MAIQGTRELNQFELKKVSLPILEPGALGKAEEFRLLHLGDLHMIPGQEEKIAWVSALDSLAPDLVVNTGDNLSDTHAVPDVLAALGPLLNRPGLFVFGTNDYWAPLLPNPINYLRKRKNTPSYVDLPWEGMRAAFIERGWVDLTNTRHDFKLGSLRFTVAGVDDPHHDLDEFPAGQPNPDANFRLGLTHSPEPRVLSKFAAEGTDLALAGHTHGGQLCLPGGRAIVTNSGIDTARVQGLSTFDGMALHVTNGLGTSKFVPFRLNCKPSATLITLTEAR